MANNNSGQSPADIAGIISSVAVAVVLTVVGIYSKLASIGARKAGNGAPKTVGKALDSDERNRLDAALEFADDYRERLKASEGRLQALESALSTSKSDCLAQIEAVNSQRDKQLAAVVADYDGRLDKQAVKIRALEDRLHELENGVSAAKGEL